MNRRIKGDALGRYMLTPAPEDCGFEYGMLISVDENSLITPSVVFEDGQKCLSYDITGLRDLEEAFSGKVFQRPEICGIVLQINRAIELLDKYLLCEQNLVIDERSIYADQNMQLRFCIHPLVEESFDVQLRTFLGFLLIHTDFDDTVSLRLSAELFAASCRKDLNFCELIKLLLDDRKTLTDDLPDRLLENEPPDADPALIYDAGIPQEDRISRETLLPAGFPEDLKETLLRIGISLAIMTAGLAAVYILRGKTAVRHAMTIYLILCASITAYLFLDFIAGRHRRGRDAA